jgi:hypothetical protein
MAGTYTLRDLSEGARTQLRGGFRGPGAGGDGRGIFRVVDLAGWVAVMSTPGEVLQLVVLKELWRRPEWPPSGDL